ncbi:alpha-L-fucosidase [Thermotoga sp. KOL6]|uniref:alpha-L-fucosidase n=1 Tax=Thermotoga sp. KOL6 TaxID=126741 RepID=UPI000C78DDD7|nr:alpha-L-fucosidase [Thermotoga sp. KOL6]PLV59047.1 alpha-L-fucosidase [Thermotoga sp. KOL6]
MGYKPTWESLRGHSLPTWFDEAKFGIFIHWGIYSVPGWAPPTGELGKVPMDIWFVRNPYAEWYENSLRIKGSPTWEYHVKNYGENFKYEQFADLFTAEKWDPREWAELFKKSGAKYTVLTTKHHDGFCLWKTRYTDFNALQRGPKRDIVEDFSKAVRDVGLRFGVYYSGGLDWRFTTKPIEHVEDFEYIKPNTYEYSDYAYKQIVELIDSYSPDILWNDIEWPEKGREDVKYLFAYYYNNQPKGVVNDRWKVPHWDFRTAEYHLNYPDDIPGYKWEFTRGMGLSFGFNRNEKAEHMLTIDQLVRVLVDVVSKGGNLLLNVGPKADGTIPQIQRERLLGIGRWLEKYGKVIYGTRPWERCCAKTEDNLEIRFTTKNGKLYVIFLGIPEEERVIIRNFNVEGKVRHFLTGKYLDFKNIGENSEIIIPKSLSKHDDRTLILEVELSVI